MLIKNLNFINKKNHMYTYDAFSEFLNVWYSMKSLCKCTSYCKICYRQQKYSKIGEYSMFCNDRCNLSNLIYAVHNAYTFFFCLPVCN